MSPCFRRSVGATVSLPGGVSRALQLQAHGPGQNSSASQPRRGHLCKRPVKLWRLTEDGRKLSAGTIEAADPRELVLKWSAFLATAERGVYFATYRGSFVGREPALDNDAGAAA